MLMSLLPATAFAIAAAAQSGTNAEVEIELKTSDKADSLSVSLPYTLAEDETAEDIVVWIMDDDGALTPVTARYENGLLIITTTRLGKCVIGAAK